MGIGESLSRSLVPDNDLVVASGAKTVDGVVVDDGARIGATAVVVHVAAGGTAVTEIPARPLCCRW
jgi:serine acetyltransferase